MEGSDFRRHEVMNGWRCINRSIQLHGTEQDALKRSSVAAVVSNLLKRGR